MKQKYVLLGKEKNNKGVRMLLLTGKTLHFLHSRALVVVL